MRDLSRRSHQEEECKETRSPVERQNRGDFVGSNLTPGILSSRRRRPTHSNQPEVAAVALQPSHPVPPRPARWAVNARSLDRSIAPFGRKTAEDPGGRDAVGGSEKAERGLVPPTIDAGGTPKPVVKKLDMRVLQEKEKKERPAGPPAATTPTLRLLHVRRSRRRVSSRSPLAICDPALLEWFS